MDMVIELRPNRSELCQHNCDEVQSYLRIGFPTFRPRCDKALVSTPLILSSRTEDGDMASRIKVEKRIESSDESC